MTNSITVITNNSEPHTSTPSSKAVLASCLLRASPSTSTMAAAVVSEGADLLRVVVVSGVVALEAVLVEGRVVTIVVGASCSRVLGCSVAFDDDDGSGGEDVLVLVVARLPVVCVAVVLAVVVVLLVTEAVVVLVSFTVFAVVTLLAGVTSEVVWVTLCLRLAVAAMV